MSEPCEKCDRVGCPTQDIRTHHQVSSYEDCTQHAVDWRDRALKAEADLKEHDDFVAAWKRKVVEEAALAAEAATLPEGCRWGEDAMEQFDFGKERAALAIRGLKS